MNAAAKRIDAMRANPRADWQIADLEAVARAVGMTVRKSGGSHVVFAHVCRVSEQGALEWRRSHVQTLGVGASRARRRTAGP